MDLGVAVVEATPIGAQHRREYAPMASISTTSGARAPAEAEVIWVHRSAAVPNGPDTACRLRTWFREFELEGCAAGISRRSDSSDRVPHYTPSAPVWRERS